jgi:hypothetical protein
MIHGIVLVVIRSSSFLVFILHHLLSSLHCLRFIGIVTSTCSYEGSMLSRSCRNTGENQLPRIMRPAAPSSSISSSSPISSVPRSSEPKESRRPPGDWGTEAFPSETFGESGTCRPYKSRLGMSIHVEDEVNNKIK